MKKMSVRFHKTLRALFRAIGVSVISLIIQACYGPMTVAYGPLEPPNNRFRFQGTVKAKKTDKPIKGIQVSVDGFDEDDAYVLTDNHGFFSYTIWYPTLEEYTLRVKDIDGLENDGLFKETTKTINQDDSNTLLSIIMEEEDTETDD